MPTPTPCCECEEPVFDSLRPRTCRRCNLPIKMISGEEAIKRFNNATPTPWEERLEKEFGDSDGGIIGGSWSMTNFIRTLLSQTRLDTITACEEVMPKEKTTESRAGEVISCVVAGWNNYRTAYKERLEELKKKV